MRRELPVQWESRLIDTAKKLATTLRTVLKHASDAKTLRDSHEAIEKLLAYDDGVPAQTAREVLPRASMPSDRAIVGGMKNFDRNRDLVHFTRADGAWFDFALVVRERNRQAVEVLAYNFELRFVDPHKPAFVRFDLNPIGHANEEHGVRSHLHPGNDDWSLPAPMLGPFEVLDLLLYGMQARDPSKPRE